MYVALPSVFVDLQIGLRSCGIRVGRQLLPAVGSVHPDRRGNRGRVYQVPCGGRRDRPRHRIGRRPAGRQIDRLVDAARSGRGAAGARAREHGRPGRPRDGRRNRVRHRRSATKLGPALVTTTVYVIPNPGMYVVLPSVFVICRSACGAAVSVSVACCCPPPGPSSRAARQPWPCLPGSLWRSARPCPSPYRSPSRRPPD